MLILELMKLAPFPTPPNLIRQWQEGEIEREEMQRLMGEHQKELLKEGILYLEKTLIKFGNLIKISPIN